MKISEILSSIEKISPLAWQESYDNAGLIVGNDNDEVNKVLVTLDVTDDVLNEAIAGGFDFIIAHHPLIFKGLKRMNDDDLTSRLVRKAIKHDIAIAAMHTNLDNSPVGVSERLATHLGLNNLRVLQPLENMRDEAFQPGAGMIGEFDKELDEREFLSLVKNTLGSGFLRHSAMTGKKIKTVAVCGGSGAFLINEAKCQKADAFVTADIKYHDFALADNKILLVDAGHFETEQFVCEFLAELIKKNCIFAVCISKIRTNYVNYFG